MTAARDWVFWGYFVRGMKAYICSWGWRRRYVKGRGGRREKEDLLVCKRNPQARILESVSEAKNEIIGSAKNISE